MDILEGFTPEQMEHVQGILKLVQEMSVGRLVLFLQTMSQAGLLTWCKRGLRMRADAWSYASALVPGYR